jgi:integrase
MQRSDYAVRVTGSLYQRGGKWGTRLRIGDPSRACGYRDERQLIGPAWTSKADEAAPGTYTKRMAREALSERIVAARWSEHERQTERQTFAAAAKAHLGHVERVERAEVKTVLDLQAILDSRLLPVFGHRALDTITSAEVATYRDSLIAEGRLSPRSVRRDLGLVRAVLGRAVAEGKLGRNVADADAVKRPKLAYDPSSFAVLDAEQVRAVAGQMPDVEGRAMVLTAAFAGLRLGELVALTRGDVEGDRLRVRRSWNGARVKAPKSGKGRTVPLALEVRAALDDLRELHGEPGEGAHLFTADGGRPKGDRFRAAFYRALDDAGLGHLREGEHPIRVHDLRHTFASLAIAGGAPMTAVQAWCGHSSLTITSRYSHWQDGAGDAAMLDRAFGAVAA